MLDEVARDETGDRERPFRFSGEITAAEVQAAFDEAMLGAERARRWRDRRAEAELVRTEL